VTPDDLKRVRAEARAMTVEALCDAHAEAIAKYATAATAESAQHFHDLAGEYAEAYQRATNPNWR
jgi:hypothetical protein